MYKGGTTQDLRAFHNDVNKLLHDIDQPINDDDLSDVDDEDLLVSIYIQFLFSIYILDILGRIKWNYGGHWWGKSSSK